MLHSLITLQSDLIHVRPPLQRVQNSFPCTPQTPTAHSYRLAVNFFHSSTIHSHRQLVKQQLELYTAVRYKGVFSVFKIKAQIFQKEALFVCSHFCTCHHSYKSTSTSSSLALQTEPPCSTAHAVNTSFPKHSSKI